MKTILVNGDNDDYMSKNNHGEAMMIRMVLMSTVNSRRRRGTTTSRRKRAMAMVTMAYLNYCLTSHCLIYYV